MAPSPAGVETVTPPVANAALAADAAVPSRIVSAEAGAAPTASVNVTSTFSTYAGSGTTKRAVRTSGGAPSEATA